MSQQQTAQIQPLSRGPRCPEHPLRGQLMRGCASRTISHNLGYSIRVLQCETPVDVFILDIENKDIPTRAMFMAYYYSFFQPVGDRISDQPHITGAMLGLLFNVIDYRSILENNKLEALCIEADFKPIFRILSEDEDIESIVRSERTVSFLGKFGKGYERFLHDRAQQIIMLGPILLTIGKKIQTEGYEGWITNRMRAFMGTLGLENSETIWTDQAYPAALAMKSISTFLSAVFYLRREIFMMCYAVASSQCSLSYLFKDVVKLLRGTGMDHILLIDEYLYKRYRELLSISILSHNYRGMMAAWKYLASLSPHEVYYAMLLFPKEETACLNRNNFPLYVAAALAAARFDNPSVVNYRGAETQSRSEIYVENIVAYYLPRRLALQRRAND
jgi:hypothetical protein